MDKTYVVYTEEYYFNMQILSTIVRKNVYNVSYNSESAEEAKSMIEEALQKSVDAAELNAKNEILTTFSIKVIELDKKYSIEEAKEIVIDDDYTGDILHKKDNSEKII